jgi:predicted dehydrogenase
MTLRIALTGAGYIGKVHAMAARNLGGRVAAVVSRPSDNRHAVAAAHGAAEYDDIQAALEAGGFDAVVVCTPNYLHAPESIAALEAGLPVMVEKPMAMNATEAGAMVQAAARSGAALMVAHCWRFDPDVLWLKEQAGRLGRIVRTHGYGVHTHWGPSGWFTEARFAGGGAMADMGIHALDTARFLLGDPNPVSVYARIGTNYTPYDVDDTGLILVNWDNGTTSLIESGWWQPHSDGPEAATRLYGTEGYGSLFPTKLELPNRAEEKLDVIDPGFPFPRPEHCPQSMYDDQMRYFFDCVTGGRAPVPGGAEGLTNMRVVDAAYASARSGQVVDI